MFTSMDRNSNFLRRTINIQKRRRTTMTYRASSVSAFNIKTTSTPVDTHVIVNTQNLNRLYEKLPFWLRRFQCKPLNWILINCFSDLLETDAVSNKTEAIRRSIRVKRRKTATRASISVAKRLTINSEEEAKRIINENLNRLYDKFPPFLRKLKCRPLNWILTSYFPDPSAENEYEENTNTLHRYRPKPIDDLVKETRFSKKEIQLLYRGFKQECPSGIVNEQIFREIYSTYFPQGDCGNYAHFVFSTIDQNCDGIVNFEEFLLGLSILLRGSLDEKLRWIFNLYDINRDGKITIDELRLITMSVYELMGRYTDPPIDDLTCKSHIESVFNKLDVSNNGEITMDDFLKACYKDNSILNSIAMLDTAI